MACRDGVWLPLRLLVAAATRDSAVGGCASVQRHTGMAGVRGRLGGGGIGVVSDTLE